MTDNKALNMRIWLSSIVESSDDPIFSNTLDGVIQSWNTAASDMFGYEANEIIGKHFSIMIPREKQEEERMILENVVRGNRIEQYATERKDKKGILIPVSLSVSPIFDEDKKVIGASVIARDLLQKNEMEKKNAMLAAIVDSSDDAIVSKDLNGIIKSWNRSAEKIFGYKAEEAIGKHITLIIPETHKSEEDYIIGQIKKGNRIDHFETYRRTKSGDLIPLSITVSPIEDTKGNIIGASKIARTLSAQRQAEEKQAILASIVQSSDDAIISKTLNGIITSWNPGAERILGYTEKEMVGKSIHILLPEDRQDEESEILGKIRKGEKIDHYETIRVRKDGKKLNVSITVSPIKDKKGIITGASKILRDITEDIESKKLILEQSRKLEELNRSKDEFIGIASHELKTPMTSIKAYLQLMERLLETSEDARLTTYLGKTLNYLAKLEILVSDLLDVSKIQAGKLVLELKECDFGTLIKDAVEGIQNTTSSHTISTDIKFRNQKVVADHNRIEQVLINFLTNAIKYSPENKDIRLDAWIEKESVYVKVTDQGIGIAEENKTKIFDRFYRAEGIAPAVSGLGIGLFISCEIIRRHHGEIWVESEVGKGSSFYFCIPIRQ